MDDLLDDEDLILHNEVPCGGMGVETAESAEEVGESSVNEKIPPWEALNKGREL